MNENQTSSQFLLSSQNQNDSIHVCKRVQFTFQMLKKKWWIECDALLLFLYPQQFNLTDHIALSIDSLTLVIRLSLCPASSWFYYTKCPVQFHIKALWIPSVP